MPGHQRCAIHDEEEPFDDTTYFSCFECGHVYPREENLLSEWRQLQLKLPEDLRRTITDADLVPFCPLCLHDI